MPKINITKIAALAVHSGSVYTLVKAPNSDFFYSGGGDGRVVRWNSNDLSTGVMVAQVKSTIFSLLPLGDAMLVGQMLGGIHVLDLIEKKEFKHIVYHSQGIFDLRLSPDGNKIFAAGGDGLFTVWNPIDFSLLNALEISDESVRQLAFHPTQNLLALGCSNNKIYIMNTDDFGVEHELESHSNSVFSVCFSPDGNLLLTGSRDAQLKVWDANNDYQLLTTIPAHLFTINSIVFSPEGKYFATASRDKTIKIWDSANFELLKVIDKEKTDGHVNSVNKLLWISDTQLISCSDDRSVMVWNIESVN